jgi:cell division protein FtsQ
MLTAGLIGVVVFIGLSEAGRTVRTARPLPQQIDRLLVAAGLSINEVQLTGHRLTLDSDVYAALRLEDDNSILRFDVASARKRIEALAWVAEAQVVRVLPDKIRVGIRERRPAAVWRHGERLALLDATGRVLAHVAPGSASPLPVIAGAGAPQALSGLLEGLGKFPELARRITLATRVGGRRWSLSLANGALVHLPESSGREDLGLLADLDRRTAILDQGPQIIDLRRRGIVAVSPVLPPAEARTGVRRAASLMLE